MSGRIPPSEQIRQMMNPFLNQADTSEQPASDFLKLAVQLVARQILEQEVADFVGWEQYERQLEHTGYRNGYKPGRIRSAEGTIPLQVSQMRAALSPYHSRLLEFLRGNTDVLDCRVIQIDRRGLSTRDVEIAMLRQLRRESGLEPSSVIPERGQAAVQQRGG